MSLHRLLRLLVAAFLIGATVITLSPYALSYVASTAIVNAPVVTLRTPYDGTLAEASAPAGTGVRLSDPLARLVVDESHRREFTALVAEQSGISGEIGALQTQLSALEALDADLRTRKASYRDHAADWLREAIRQAEAEARAARLEQDNLLEELARTRALEARGALSAVALSDVEKELAIAEAERIRSDAQVDALRIKAKSLEAGVVMDGVSDGLQDIVNRLTDVELRSGEVKRQIAALQSRLGAVSRQIGLLMGSAINSNVLVPRAMMDGVIWQTSPPQGTRVLAGDVLVQYVDCTRRFLQVELPERYFERFQVGDVASIRLKGSETWINGRVRSVRGPGSHYDRPDLAAHLGNATSDQIAVQVDLPPIDIAAGGAAGFCDVGRTADVHFAREREGVLGLATKAMAGMQGRVLTALKGISGGIAGG